MKTYSASTLAALLLSTLLCASIAQAQVYKWVGPDGKVNYGDVPPAKAAGAEKKSLPGNVVDSGGLPFELKQAAESAPVTLYTGAKCAPCDSGRNLLSARGIPFTEKTVSSNADIALLGGGSQVELPQLAVGPSRQSGFDANAWNTRLTAAGYPDTSKLPKNYRNPAPGAAAPVEKERADIRPGDVANVASDPRNRAPAPGAAAARQAKPVENTIPGLRF